MNKVFLMGNLTRDVELKIYGNSDVARTGIAVNRQFSKNKEVDFFNLTAFGKTADFMNKYFAKGSKIAIEGHLRFSQYEDKSGEKRSAVDVIVEHCYFADGKKKAVNDDGLGGEYIPDEDTPFF